MVDRYLAVIDAFNSKCSPWMPKAKLTDDRRAAIKECWSRVGTSQSPMEWFEGLFDRAASSDFLCRRTGSKGEQSSFVASFDWLMKPSNALKVLEGNFDRRTPPSTKSQFGQAF
jgi:hypothetical protein